LELREGRGQKETRERGETRETREREGGDKGDFLTTTNHQPPTNN
jgi:hypothetical protein